MLTASVHAQLLLRVLEAPNPESGGSFGLEVSAVPDLSGDGLDDVVVGAPGEGSGDTGQVHVFNGVTGAQLYAIGNSQLLFFGNGVAGVPDLDGDGKGDFAVYTQLRFTALLVEVHSGASGGLLYTLQSPRDPLGGFGFGMAGFSDLDGDGAGDLVIGALSEDYNPILGMNAGRAYGFSGAGGELSYILASPYKMRDANFGFSVAPVPDLDNDGISEVAIGAPFESPDGKGVGRAYVFSGATGRPLLELAPPNRIREGAFGWAVAGLKDIDGDGEPDVAVGAPRETVPGGPIFAGRVHIFSGKTGALVRTLISSAPMQTGFFGQSLARLEDTDGDGMDDLLIGSPGRIFVRSGRASVYNPATGALQYDLTSPDQEALFGYSVSGLQDVDGDGRGDFVVSSPLDGIGGQVFIYSGALAAR